MSIRRISQFALLLAGIWGGLSAADGSAQTSIGNYPDRVTIQPRNSTGTKAIRCRVLDYTGRNITLLESGQVNQSIYSSDEVLRVETPQSEPHRQGLQSLAAGRVDDADRLLREALNRETREWVRREILADLVRASLWKGDYTGASARFGLLYSSDPLTRHFGFIPVVWSEKTVDDGQRRAASSLVVESSPVSQLVGASILLVGSDHEELAKDTLKALTGGNDRNLRQLAEAQLWRLKVREQNVAAHELERWQRQVEDLPETMRGGPYFVLGQGYRSKLLRDQAALAMLRLPILYPHDRPLVARACVEAGEILQSQGRTAEAIGALREAVVRFPETIVAQEARSILEQRTDGKQE